MVKKQDQNLSQVTSINSSSESNNLITIDAKDKCKNAKQPENITIASKRPFPFFTEILINPGMTQKKIKENHYFSKKPLIFDPFATDVEELFGLSHVLYLNNNDFVKTYIKNKDNDLSFLETLSLQNPYKICSHFYLNNIGQYYFTKKNKLQKLVPINNEDLKENEDFENLQFGNRFCTFRMYKSFLNTGLLVYYYQFKVYVKEIDLTFYVVLPEDGVADFHNRDLLLFHTNLNELMSALFLKIQEKQKGENSFRPFRFLQNKKCLFPTILPDIIYDKILKKYNNNSFDIERNLEETFKKFESEINSIEKISCDSLEPLINQFFESLLSKYDLPKMHLGDFFFGYNLPKIQALVKLVKRNKNFSLNRFPEDLKAVFCNLSPYLKLKQKLAFSDLQDNKIPLPYKCLRL